MEKRMKKRMNKRINTNLFAVGLLMVALPLTVVAAEEECFPLCKVPVPVQTSVEIAIDAKLDPLAVVTRFGEGHPHYRNLNPRRAGLHSRSAAQVEFVGSQNSRLFTACSSVTVSPFSFVTLRLSLAARITQSQPVN